MFNNTTLYTNPFQKVDGVGLAQYCGLINDEIKMQIANQMTNIAITYFFIGVITTVLTVVVIWYVKWKSPKK